MKLQDLTREQLMLLNTDFGEELEKQAAAYVEDESYEYDELEKTASSLLNYGAELAMEKIAEMEAKADEEKEEKEKKPIGLEKAEEPKKEEGEGEKTAAAMGNLVLEGYWDTLMEKGAEYYGDPAIYVEELIKEAGMPDFVTKNWGKARELASKAGGKIKDAYTHQKGGFKGMYEGGKKAVVGTKDQAGKMIAGSRGEGRKQLGRGMLTASPTLGAAALAAGGTGYALSGNKKKKK